MSAARATVNPELEGGGLGEAITVVGRAEAIELNKTNPNLAITATSRQAVELPLPGRNINNLALLGPNTFTAPGSTGISANGNRARNNNFMIDGTDNNDLSVTIQTTPVLPEEVAEYQSGTANFSAEFGRNSGAQINVITRSGTNKFKAEVWDYYRSGGLNSLDNLEKASGLEEPTKSVRHQAGFSVGGPIIKNKTFFFGLFQRDSTRTGETLGATVRIPTAAGYAALQNVPLRAGQSTASRQAVLQRLSFLTGLYSKNPALRNVSTLNVNGVPIETAQVNFGRFTPNTTYKYTGRMDHQLALKDNLTLRYSLNRPDTTNNNSNTQFAELFARQHRDPDHNAALSHTHIFGPNALNEFRVSYVRRDLQFPENDPTSPTATITGLFTVGGSQQLPPGARAELLPVHQHHLPAAGAPHLQVRSGRPLQQARQPGRLRLQGHLRLRQPRELHEQPRHHLQPGAADLELPGQAVAVVLLRPGRLPGEPRLHPEHRPALRAVHRAPRLLRSHGRGEPERPGAPPVKRDYNNVAPRVGFAWSPRSSGFFGDGKSSIRGGYGIAYDVLFYNLLTVNASNYPRVVVVTQNNALDVYPNKTTASGAAVFNPLAGYVNSDENTQHPMTHFYSLSMQREVGRDYVFQVGYTGSTGRHGVNQQQMNPAILTEAQAALVRATGNQLAIPNVQARRLFPQYGSRTMIPTDVGPGGNDASAISQYHALFLQVNKKMSHGLQAGLSYTLSRLESNNDESLGVGDITGSASQVPQDYFDISSEYGLSVFDRTHRFVVNYIWEIPGPKEGALKHIIGGWQLSGITAFQSGQPFTVVTGQDTNGNGTAGGDRPNLTGSGSFDWDDEHKGFTNNGCYVAPLGTNGLPFANSLGNGSAPRNGERAAGFLEHPDLSLMKRFFVFGRPSQLPDPRGTRSTSSTRTTTASRSANMPTAAASAPEHPELGPAHRDAQREVQLLARSSGASLALG